MEESELSYALGKDGTTRRKLARASGCIMEYVGQLAFLCGTLDERQRARTYLKWLLKQRHGPVTVDYEERDDVRESAMLYDLLIDDVRRAVAERRAAVMTIERCQRVAEEAPIGASKQVVRRKLRRVYML